MALSMPITGQGRITFDDLAERTGLLPAKLREMLEATIQKGLVLAQINRRGEDVYCLWDFMYSLYAPLYGDGFDDDYKRRIAAIREKLWQSGFNYLWFSSSYPFNRVIPHEKSIAPGEHLETWERVSNMVAQSEKIAVIACGCRASSKNCDRPLWTCLYLDREADYWVKHRGGKYLSHEECLELLDRTGKAGLVMTVPNSQEIPRVICNCCNDCCIIMRTYIENHNPYALSKSNFAPVFDTEKCKVCLTCMQICPVEAIGRVPAHEAGKRDQMTVITEQCIGCGVCALACPNGALKLTRQRDIVPVPTTRETFARMSEGSLW